MWLQKKAINSEDNQFIATSRGGKSTKIHAVVDELGNSICFKLSGGNIHDSSITINILSNIDISNSTILADKAYDTNKILDYLQTHDANYVIPPKSSMKNKLCKWN